MRIPNKYLELSESPPTSYHDSYHEASTADFSLTLGVRAYNKVSLACFMEPFEARGHAERIELVHEPTICS